MQGHDIPYGSSEVDVASLAGGSNVLTKDPPVPGKMQTAAYMDPTPLDSPRAIGANQAVWYGWLSEPQMVAGMGRLLIDSLIKMPVSTTPTVARPPLIQRSAYEQIAHYRHQQDLNFLSRQLGPRDDSNTRFSNIAADDLGNAGPGVSGPRVKTSGQAGRVVQPSGAVSTPPIEHSLYLAAWRVPRFSTEPYTIIPESSP